MTMTDFDASQTAPACQQRALATEAELDALDGLRAWIEAEAKDRGMAEALYPPERQCAPALAHVTALRAERDEWKARAEAAEAKYPQNWKAAHQYWREQAEKAEARIAELEAEREAMSADIANLTASLAGEVEEADRLRARAKGGDA